MKPQVALGLGLAALAWSASVDAANAGYPRVEITSAARAHVRANIKDPGSAQFRNEFTARPGTYCGEVNAKNGFGGYAGFKRFITNERTLLVDDGSIPEFKRAWREFCMQKPNGG
jgi:hypothetical protein